MPILDSRAGLHLHHSFNVDCNASICNLNLKFEFEMAARHMQIAIGRLQFQLKTTKC